MPEPERDVRASYRDKLWPPPDRPNDVRRLIGNKATKTEHDDTSLTSSPETDVMVDHDSRDSGVAYVAKSRTGLLTLGAVETTCRPVEQRDARPSCESNDV